MTYAMTNDDINYKPRMCCGNLVEVNRGIKLLGIWSFLQTSMVFMQGFNLIMTD